MVSPVPDFDAPPLTARLAAVAPAAYARNRNHLDGAATGLSPWVTHGALSVPALIEQLGLSGQDMLAFQLGFDFG